MANKFSQQLHLVRVKWPKAGFHAVSLRKWREIYPIRNMPIHSGRIKFDSERDTKCRYSLQRADIQDKAFLAASRREATEQVDPIRLGKGSHRVKPGLQNVEQRMNAPCDTTVILQGGCATTKAILDK
jgi:hypothetical protein